LFVLSPVLIPGTAGYLRGLRDVREPDRLEHP
jgi:hypothetical protein